MLGGWWHLHIDRFPHLIALDRDGQYLREVYPPMAKLVPEKTPALPTLRLADGSFIPQVQSWWDLYIPAMVTARSMVATPDGHLLVAERVFGRWTNHVVGSKLVKFSPQGRQLAEVDVRVVSGHRRIPMRIAGMGIATKGANTVLSIAITSLPDGCNGYPTATSMDSSRSPPMGRSWASPR